MRLATMVQMLGVIVLALGLEQAFASIEDGDILDNGVMVAGYVVMRVPMIFLWLRAARHDPPRQPGGDGVRLDDRGRPGLLGRARDRRPADRDDVRDRRRSSSAIEMIGPFIAQRRKGGTPWHAHHIAERYGLLVIITLGEGVIGTVASINAVVHGSEGWTVDAAVVAFAGIGLIFATWWTYFAIPWADVLQLHRERSFTWGYGHIVVFGSLAAIGGGPARRRLLPRARDDARADGHRAEHGDPGLDLHRRAVRRSTRAFTRHLDPFHLLLLAGTAAVIVLSVVLAGRRRRRRAPASSC